MKLAVLLLAAAACSSGGGDDYPVGPGGTVPPIHSGGGGDGGVSDAGMDGGDGGTTIAGRVCVLDDLRDLGKATLCATTTAGGLNVTLDGKTVKTAADGTFVIGAPGSSAPFWKVDSGNTGTLVTTFAPLGVDNLIPAITTDRWIQIQGGSMLTLGDNAGSIIVRLTHGGAPLAGVTATSSPAAAFDARYDGTDKDIWDIDRSGAKGLVWIPGVQVMPNGMPIGATVTLNAGAAPVPVVTTVWDQAITFVSKAL
jgi:hypothetical protein